MSQAQDADVNKKVEDSYKHYEHAFKDIKLAISTMENCDNTHTSDVIHNYAQDAIKYLVTANSHIGFAKYDANATEKKAADMHCTIAEAQADDAKGYFYDAEKKITTAIRHLSNTKYKKNLTQLSYSISDANDDMNHALIKMTFAVNKLNETLASLEECHKN